MDNKGLIVIFAAMLALAVPVAFIATDALSDDTDLSGEPTIFGEGTAALLVDGANGFEITSETIFGMCLLAAIGIIALAYYYRS